MSSPSDPNPPAFDSYEAYEDYINSTALYDPYFRKIGEDHTLLEREDVWLARFTGPERSAQWYRYWDDSAWEGKQPPTVPVNEHSEYNIVTSSRSFHNLLKTFNEQTGCQVLVLALDSYDRLTNQTVDMLGLGLDMPQEAWMSLRHRGDPTYWSSGAWLTTAWTPNYPVLNIGDNSIVVLDAVPGVRLKTAILLLVNKAKTKYHRIQRYASERLTLPYWWLLSASREGPNASRRKSLSRYLQPSPREDLDTWMLRSYLTVHGGSTIDKYGPGNDLFVCFSALLQLHISKPSRNIPSLKRVDGKIGLKYYVSGALVDSRTLWLQLRQEMDAHRHLLAWLPYQLGLYFDKNSTELQTVLSQWSDRLKLHSLELELAEATLRDYISMQSSEKSTEMAEQSIKESKRVILLTALAFIFLPLSLSASIYGMNIQEINNTGKPIKSFAVTAVSMVAASVFLWTSLAGLMSLRSLRIRQRQDDMFFKLTPFLWNQIKAEVPYYYNSFLEWGPYRLIEHVQDGFVWVREKLDSRRSRTDHPTV